MGHFYSLALLLCRVSSSFMISSDG